VEKKQGMPEGWENGILEVVLRPLEKRAQKMIKAFKETTGLNENCMKIRTYEKGLTFISIVCDRKTLSVIEKFNPLRTVHPLGEIDIDPFRMAMPEVEGPKPTKKKMKSNITVGVFDGGVNEDLSLLKGYIRAIDEVNTKATV